MKVSLVQNTKNPIKTISDIATMLLENNNAVAKSIIRREYPHAYVLKASI